MNNYLKVSWLVVFFVVLPSLTSCNEIPLGEYNLEWDEYDPRLHDQTIQFNKPMRYVLLEEKHIGEYPKENVEIGRLLTLEEDVFEPGGYAKGGYISQQIKDGMKFTVKASYWLRKDFIGREFAGDMRYLIMADEQGIRSVMPFYEFINSDKPELYKLHNEGH